MNFISVSNRKSVNWSTIVLFVLGFWLSSSLILDLLVIPGLLTTGMMSQPGFASAGYVIFGTFNRLEILAAALVLTACLASRYQHYLTGKKEIWSLALAAIVLLITLVYTYFLTPEMSSLGLSLSLGNSIDLNFNTMAIMHEIYWGLEIIKLIACTVLLRWFYRSSCTLV